MIASAAQRLFDGYPDDPLALYAVALSCHVQPQPCPHPEFFTRLVGQFPDNAVHWLLLPSGASPSDAELAAQVIAAAKAPVFDDRHFAYADLLRAAMHAQPLPDSILEPMQAVLAEADAMPSLQRNTLDNVPFPKYLAIARLCRPDSAALRDIPGLADACGRLAEQGLRSPDATILSRMFCSAMLRRLYPGSALATEALAMRRQYVWLSEQIRPLKIDSEAMQNLSEHHGEWEALQRYAEQAGIARQPPPDWQPENPQQVLLPEDRAARASR